jgi:DDE_Tnp_1-associated
MSALTAGPSLLEAVATVPDPRQAGGRRHPLPAILALATAAMLAGARTVYAIAQWGRLQEPAVIRALGFTRPRSPAVSTLHLVFKALDAEAFEAALAHWAQAELGEQPVAIAIDGKALRGSHGEKLPGVDLVAAYADAAGLVLAQTGGQARTGRGGMVGGAALAAAGALGWLPAHGRRAVLSA